MMDAAFIKECADPSLKPAIVEQFVKVAGAPDPLAITVKSGGRLVLVPKARTTDEAMAIIKQNIAAAVVRVGLTQFPAGVGVKSIEDLKPSLVDGCGNVRMGTTMFAKVLRIVAKWYGNPTSEKVFPEIFDDAVYAWKTGEFDGKNVFQQDDPGGKTTSGQDEMPADLTKEDAGQDEDVPKDEAQSASPDLGSASIRIDLSRIGGQK